MAKYIVKRLFHGIVSIITVLAIVMVLIFTLLDRNSIFLSDSLFNTKKSNAKIVYKYEEWEKYGYLDYVDYIDYMNELVKNGKIDEDLAMKASNLGKTPNNDSNITNEWVNRFTNYYEEKGYAVVRLNYENVGDASSGKQRLFAHKDISLATRLINYFGNLIEIDSLSYAKEVKGKRGLSFTWFDPAYGGQSFSPAILGNGTKHKYLLYFDSKFPFIHQNFININLGKSYAGENKGKDIVDVMTDEQGTDKYSDTYFPSGVVEYRAEDMHSLEYQFGASKLYPNLYVDDYIASSLNKDSLSRIGNSFLIGIIASILTYLIGVPIGILMAKNKNKLIDKLGTIYIVFILAVPSLAYIFMFRSIGDSLFNLPTSFNLPNQNKILIYILPIVSLALPQAANIMKWLRRYMVDQMGSDYVKFAKSSGLGEKEIFTKHVLKNSAIPLIHGIPGTILGALTGAIITESVYSVPGTGGLLTDAISIYDNGSIIALTFFYACLTVLSLILGDLLIKAVDPRISFEE